MRVNPRLFASLSLVAFAAIFNAQTGLDAGFKNPPNSAKPHTWWHWINGNISKRGITADLEAMKKIGLGGAQIFNVEVGIPVGKTPMMTPQWQEAMAWAFKEAKRLNIEICVHNCGGWSSSGGPWVKPADAMQFLTWSETTVVGPKRFDGVLAKPQSKLNYYKDIEVYAVRKASNSTFRNPNIRTKASFDRGDKMAPEFDTIPSDAVIPKTDVQTLHMDASGRVNWDAPEGEWTIIRMGHTPTGAVNSPSPESGRGPEVDKLSRTAMDHFWSGMMADVLKDNGTIQKFGLNNALIDSYEVGSQNWTPKMREEFMKRRGYDPMPFLPAVTGRIVQSGELTERFLWDWRRTICDLFSDNYFQYFKELCHKNGLKFSTEGYGNGSFDNLQVSGLADIPMGEFWVPNGMAQESTKLASSAAHTNGKPVVGAESFTADDVRGRWLVDPYSIKALGDRIFTLGINRYIFHRYAHQPWADLEPGMTMGPWGMNLDRTITWWDQGQAWMKYITRSQYLLQSGRFVADVVAFTGEEGPNDLPLMKGNGFPEGYDYDGCDATVLHQMRVENGQIVLPTGMRYRVLTLPTSKWMTTKTIKKIAQLVNDGATVVGPAPQKSPSLSDYPAGDQEVQSIANQVWTMNSKRHAYDLNLMQVLKDKHIAPDITSTRPVNWIHRVAGNTDIYFVANPAYRPVDIDVSFRVGDRQPELWNPETGATENAPVWQAANGRTRVSMRLESAGSTFVIFRNRATTKHLTSLVWLGVSAAEPKPPKVEVISARYEAVDGSGGVDATEKAKSMIDQGQTEIGATNSNFGDPTVNKVKHLHIVYTVDGKRFDKKIAENGSLEFMVQGPEDAPPNFLIANGAIQPWKAGKIKFTNSDGTSGVIGSGPAIREHKDPWSFQFAQKNVVRSATFTKLMSWTDSTVQDIKYFSGTGTYRTVMNATSAEASGHTWLDLGKVKNFAEVELNGHKFETLWKAPFRVDVSGYLKPGQNSLLVKVTNLWPNRLIGDEQYPAQAKYNGGPIAEWPQWILDGKPRPPSERSTFTTWKFYDKDSPLLDSGLMGPVRLVTVKPISTLNLRGSRKR